MVNLNPFRRQSQAQLVEQAVRLLGENQQAVTAVLSENAYLRESLDALVLAQDDVGWMRLSDWAQQEFSRDGLRRITERQRIMSIVNPLIKRGLLVQLYYVWAQGVTIQSRNKDVNEVVQYFLDDPDNRAEFSSHKARVETDREQYVTGNTFFVLFARDGRVKVRSIPVEEIEDIIRDPEDRRRTLYYKRSWQTVELATNGTQRVRQRTAYYPDWRYVLRDGASIPDRIGQHEVVKDAPVYHLRTGGEKDWKFGMPEAYAAADWAMAYRGFLEDFATVSKALARFAFQMSGAKSAREVASWQSRLGTGLTAGNLGRETNPAPLPGSTLATMNGRLEPVRTAGATTGPEEAKALRLMAGDGLPDTFFGDVSQGTLATAKSLDRPTELKFVDRQSLWSDVYIDLCTYACIKAIEAGLLSGWVLVQDSEGDVVRVEGPNDEDGDPTQFEITVTWPDILEHDKLPEIQAIVEAVTLKGAAIKTLPPRLLTYLILAALDVQDADDWIERMFPGKEDGMEIPEPDPEPTDPAAMAARDQRAAVDRDRMNEAVRILRTLLQETMTEGKHD